MASADFNPDDWKSRLSRAASGVAAAQENHRDEIYELFVERSLRQTDTWPSLPPCQPIEIFQALYGRVFSGDGGYHALALRFDKSHYDSLRAALVEARNVLASHPTLAPLVDPANPGAEFEVRKANLGGLCTLIDLVAGLMCRAAELGEQGLTQAATELNALLDPPDDDPATLEVDNLLNGFHVVLIHGLQVPKVTPLDHGMAILPLEFLDKFVNRRIVRDVAPEIVSRHRWDSLAALVKPFRWKPHFLKPGEDPKYELDWGGTFRDDANALIELLALFRASPIIPIVSIDHCTHPAASCLLGQFHYHSSYTLAPSVQNPGFHTSSCHLRSEALAAAKRHFRFRDGERYRGCEPVIARLAEAQARSGRFRYDDRILDVAIALEQLYQPSGDAISFKLRARAACFLESRADRRRGVFREIKALYDARSAIVHKRKNTMPAEKKADAYKKGFDVARRTVIKLLQHGWPSDWDEVVLGATNSHGNGSRNSAATTEPGYTNRNGQTVIHRTGIPGTDHNQRVYVLECGKCLHRYGANGSDIWQRRCPNCDDGRPGLCFDTSKADPG